MNSDIDMRGLQIALGVVLAVLGLFAVAAVAAVAALTVGELRLRKTARRKMPSEEAVEGAMNMKEAYLIGALVLALLSAMPALAQQRQNPRTPEALFGAAQHQEEVQGNLQAAIGGYQQVIAASGSDRRLAARAQYRIGVCYERLGREEARKAFERVVQAYAEQRDIAAQARSRLAAISEASNAANAAVPVVKQVWADRETDALGSISADGRHLTFTDWSTGDLAIRDLQTGKNRRLTDKGPWSKSSEYAEFSVISPDGKQVAYAWYVPETVKYELRVIAVNGGRDLQPRALLRDDWLRPVAWYPGGTEIIVLTMRDLTTVAAGGAGAMRDLTTVTTGGVVVRRVTDPQPGGNPRPTSLSPDGRYLLFDRQVGDDLNERDIFLLTTDGKQLPFVTHAGRDELGFWAPDGKHVLFLSDRTGRMGLWSIEVSNGRPAGAPQLVKADLGRTSPLGIASDGTYYYASEIGMVDVYVAEIDPAGGKLQSEPARVSERFQGTNAQPIWSPDGTRLAWLSRRAPVESPTTIIIREMSGKTEREIRLPANLNVRTIRWWPDGRSLLLSGLQEGGSACYRLELGTERLTVLLRSSGGAAAWRMDVSPDGQKLFYASSFNRISVRDLTSGQDEEIVSLPSTHWVGALAVSPDGGQLALLVNDTHELSAFVVPATGGKPRQLTPDQKFRIRNNSTTWSRDSRSVIVVSNPDNTDRWDLLRVPIDGTAPVVLLTMERPMQPSIHPDGRKIAVQAGIRKREIWALKNFLPSLQARR